MPTQKYKLTKSFIDSIELSPEKQTIYRDSELTGFAIRVKGSKSFIAEKKMANGVPCRVTIGTYGVWTVSQAREKAKELLLEMAQGINPNQKKSDNVNNSKAERDKEKKVPTLKQAYEFYKERKLLSANTIKAYSICVDDYYKDWQEIKLTQITEKMVLDRHLQLSKRSPAQANLAAKFLRALFNHTESRYKDDEGNKILSTLNPVNVIQQEKAYNKIRRRRTYIRADQLNDWAAGVATMHWINNQNNNMHAYTNQDYLFLLILTGFRREEAESIEWSKVDLKYRTIKITDTKNGEDLMIPIGDMLFHILSERKKRAGNSLYVFPDRKGISHISDRAEVRTKITKSTGIEFTYHDLRRTFSSIANSLAIGSYTIKRLINHTTSDDNGDVTHGYIQVSFDDLRKAMNMIENVVLSEKVRHLIKNRLYVESNTTRNAEKDWHDHINNLLKD